MLSGGGREVEDITENVDDLVVNSWEEMVFVHYVGTNNAMTGRSEEVYSEK